MDQTTNKSPAEPDLIIYQSDPVTGEVGIGNLSKKAIGAFGSEYLRTMADRHPKGPVEVTDHGPIQSFCLPAGWGEKPQPDCEWAVSSSSQEFNPVGDAASSLVLYYRGRPTSGEAGKRFLDVLKKLPHTLSSTEIDLLSETLGNLADHKAFELRSARTELLNGKTILVVDGEWKKDQIQFHGMMVDAAGNGCVIQEIFFEADQKHYTRHINNVANSLSGIKWKER